MKNYGSIFVPFRTKLSTRLITKRRRRPATVAERRELSYRLSTSCYVLSRSNGSGPSSQLTLIFQTTQKCFPCISTRSEDNKFSAQLDLKAGILRACYYCEPPRKRYLFHEEHVETSQRKRMEDDIVGWWRRPYRQGHFVGSPRFSISSQPNRPGCENL